MKVNLWFARENDNEIVGILSSNSINDYSCPICSSKVIPKAVESNKVTPHFAHIDVSKCSSEAMLHWWYKHKFIERGDTFKITTDEEIEFTCRDFDTEVTYQLDSGTYRPDLVIYTECGQEVIFEMANSNKKKVQDYIDKWIELDRIVVEIDIKTSQSEDDIKVLKALYHKGKCFNFNKRDGGYYNTIGKLKEELKSIGKYDIKLVKQLDWFWKGIQNYTIKADDIVTLSESLDSEHIKYFYEILRKLKCSDLYNEVEALKFKILNNYLSDIREFTKIILNSEIVNRKNLIEVKVKFKINDYTFYKREFHKPFKVKEIIEFINIALIAETEKWYCKVRSSSKHSKFYSQMNQSDDFRKRLKVLNRHIRKLGKVRLERQSEKYFNGYYNKQKQYKVGYYFYNLIFELKEDDDDFLLNIPLSNELYSMNENELVIYLTKILKENITYGKDDF